MSGAERPYPPPLADWLDRVAAALIDSALQSWPQLIGLVVLLATLELRTLELGDGWVPLWLPTWTGILALTLGTLLSTVIALGNRVFLQARAGQSLGKRALGLRLVGESTLVAPDVGQVFGREVCHWLDAYSYVGYLWPLWDARRQTFADKLMRTVVVEAGPRDPARGGQSSRKRTSSAAAPV